VSSGPAAPSESVRGPPPEALLTSRPSLATSIGALRYIECSARTQLKVREALEEVHACHRCSSVTPRDIATHHRTAA
jgi:hypothetical protein